MEKRKIALVGDGKIAGDCMSVVMSHPCLTLSGYFFHKNNDWSERNRQQIAAPSYACTNINERDAVRALQSLSPDLIVNVNSFDILHETILSIPRDGVINFHNGPLPQYRGVNIPTWAIYNGEKSHGVTWHLVDQQIDAGDILAETRFPVEPDETAISLTFKCLAAGLELFKSLIADYAATGILTGRPQVGDAKRYRYRDLPNDGYINFNWSRGDMSRFVRSFSFRPFSSPELKSRFRVGRQTICAADLDMLDLSNPSVEPGTVLELDSRHIVIAALDSSVCAADLFMTNGEPVEPPALPVSAGSLLSQPAWDRGRN